MYRADCPAHRSAIPDCAALHPGYGCDRCGQWCGQGGRSRC